MIAREQGAKSHVRQLNPSDFKTVLQLYASNDTLMGVDSPDRDPQFPADLLDRYLSSSDSSRALYGVFIEERLVLCMGIFFWSTLPNCTLLRLASLKGAFKGKDIAGALTMVYSGCLSEMERRRYNRFYVLSTIRHFKMTAHTFLSSPDLCARYEMAVEEVVVKNTRPRFQYAWEIMGKMTWPVDLIIRSGTLLNRYRNWDAGEVDQRVLHLWEIAHGPRPPI